MTRRIRSGYDRRRLLTRRRRTLLMLLLRPALYRVDAGRFISAEMAYLAPYTVNETSSERT